jgi:glycosyltransferase involved in cell wall biosynthesis
MAILPFRAHALGPAIKSGKAATSPRRERLAIISTSNQLCGIAAYSDPLSRHLDDFFEVKIFDLDQYLLKSNHRHIKRLADRHIREICQQLPQFDAVNVQLEHGTLGTNGRDILRRFSWLAAAAPRLSVSFHTMHLPPEFDYRGFWSAAIQLHLRTSFDIYGSYRNSRELSWGVARRLRREQRRKQVTAIAHNRRDARDVRYLYRLRNVVDHPLAFLTSAEAAEVRRRASRQAFPILDTLPDNATLIGVFGFLSDYKGFGTAIRALHYLPQNCHLMIFGGIHPNDIQPRQTLHPYLSRLFDDAYVDTSLYQRLGEQPATNASLVLNADRTLAELFGAHPKDLSERVHFMGALSDNEFRTGMVICDAVVMPYLEVGQSSSGAISQAVELGCRVIASRTRNFLEFAKYHPNTIEFFDIGNHLELAKRIIARRQFAAPYALDFNVETNKQVYLLANSDRIPPQRHTLEGPGTTAAAE